MRPFTQTIAPTLIRGVTGDMPLMREEIFGPVLPLVRCATLDDAIAFVNGQFQTDGQKSTIEVVNLMLGIGNDSLDIQGAGKLPHGDVLIMGGDQCYPQATREEYKKRVLEPFNWAFSVLFII